MAITGVGNYSSVYENTYASSRKEAAKKEETKETAATEKNAEAAKMLSSELDAPAPCRLNAPDLDFACRTSADCLHQHQQVI